MVGAWPPVSQSVTWLDISNTGLTQLPEALWELRRLEAHCNALVVVPDGLAQLLRLDYLSLHSNAITAVTPQITRLTRLRWLSLNSNLLTQRPALPPHVHRLSLHQNKIAGLPPDGLGLAGAEVRALALHLNHIPHIPACLLSSIPRCEVFTLQHNALMSVPETLGDMVGLTDLWLYSNQLTSLPRSIGLLRSLKRLWIDHNRLEVLPDSLGDCSALEELYAMDNLLAAVPASLDKCTALSKLKVDGNKPSLVPSLSHFLRTRLIGEAAAAVAAAAAPSMGAAT